MTIGRIIHSGMSHLIFKIALRHIRSDAINDCKLLIMKGLLNHIVHLKCIITKCALKKFQILPGSTVKSLTRLNFYGHLNLSGI